MAVVVDASFTVNQFCINDFSSPYKLDRNQNEDDNHFCARRYHKKNINKT